jgi:hypothetical protein
MAVTDQQFLDHTNLNNAEFANRQVTIRGFGDPRINPGVVGVPGWYYLDDNTSPPTRYEKVSTSSIDWIPSTSGGAGIHDHDERYYTQAQVDAIIAGIVGGTKVLGVSTLESPNGIIEIFTLPNGDEYLDGSLEIYVNGLYEGAPTRISSTQFQAASPPLETGDEILCSYIKI